MPIHNIVKTNIGSKKTSAAAKALDKDIEDFTQGYNREAKDIHSSLTFSGFYIKGDTLILEAASKRLRFPDWERGKKSLDSWIEKWFKTRLGSKTKIEITSYPIDDENFSDNEIEQDHVHRVKIR